MDVLVKQMQCNACGRGMADEEDDELVELETCEDCGFELCEECYLSATAAAACKCINSCMGQAYCDMDGPKAWMGARDGPRYSGPFKCAAQRAMEAQLLNDPHGGAWLSECSFAGCRKPLTPEAAKLCTRCRSVIYCSLACQKAAWSSIQHGAHKEMCGPYLPPDAWPYVSRALRAYHDHWGRFPSARPTAAQRAEGGGVAPARADKVADDEAAAADEAYRRAYLQERDALLRQAGLGELAGMEPPPTLRPESGGSDGSVDRSEAQLADAAARAASLLGGANAGGAAAMEVEPADGDDDMMLPPVMSQAEASARARALLDEARREFGRKASS